jgi:hypothetical protein
MQTRNPFDHDVPHTVQALLIRKRADHQIRLRYDARYFGEVLADHHRSSDTCAEFIASQP